VVGTQVVIHFNQTLLKMSSHCPLRDDNNEIDFILTHINPQFDKSISVFVLNVNTIGKGKYGFSLGIRSVIEIL